MWGLLQVGLVFEECRRHVGGRPFFDKEMHDIMLKRYQEAIYVLVLNDKGIV
jgi:hypothetical protein